MTDPTLDRETLRADEGNELALDRLADLTHAWGDLGELRDLLDGGCMRAGQLLTRHVVVTGDLLELQRIADAGYPQAGNELNRLLATRTDH
ncbi:MAG: hypothetical protein ACXV3F_15005 [Frankiaceae bacterium]